MDGYSHGGFSKMKAVVPELVVSGEQAANAAS
jgi:hypothetical protein